MIHIYEVSAKNSSTEDKVVSTVAHNLKDRVYSAMVSSSDFQFSNISGYSINSAYYALTCNEFINDHHFGWRSTHSLTMTCGEKSYRLRKKYGDHEKFWMNRKCADCLSTTGIHSCQVQGSLSISVNKIEIGRLSRCNFREKGTLFSTYLVLFKLYRRRKLRPVRPIMINVLFPLLGTGLKQNDFVKCPILRT